MLLMVASAKLMEQDLMKPNSTFRHYKEGYYLDTKGKAQQYRILICAAL